jgi:hypothetical protein
VWSDIPPITPNESVGYATQKPIQLLNRIIEVSTDPGDVVLDPFSGTGTALVAAQALGRKWIGVDASPTACLLAARRLGTECGLIQGVDFRLRDLAKTLEEVQRYSEVDFEAWVVTALSERMAMGTPGPLSGVLSPNNSSPVRRDIEAEFDAVISSAEPVPIEAKKSSEVSDRDVRGFARLLAAKGSKKGLLVALGFGPAARLEAARLEAEQGIQVFMFTAREILDRDRSS